MLNPFSSLISPRFPSAAVCLEGDFASVVSLDERRGRFALRAAAQAPLPENLIVPAFDQPNINDSAELSDRLADLVLNAGLGRRHRWSVALPEATARTAILVLESAAASRKEQEEMLDWKIERHFGAPLAELRMARERLTADERGRRRFLISAVRRDILAEYEALFAALGWHAGLILPRHVGETLCLTARETNADGDAAANARNGGDTLLLSSYREGFTAIIMRDRQPFIIRNVNCEAQDCMDELYRLLLFYRDRASINQLQKAADEPAARPRIARILVVGNALSNADVSASISETLEIEPRVLTAAALGISLPAPDLSFETLAAPIGLASLKWN